MEAYKEIFLICFFTFSLKDFSNNRPIKLAPIGAFLFEILFCVINTSIIYSMTLQINSYGI